MNISTQPYSLVVPAGKKKTVTVGGGRKFRMTKGPGLMLVKLTGEQQVPCWPGLGVPSSRDIQSVELENPFSYDATVNFYVGGEDLDDRSFYLYDPVNAAFVIRSPDTVTTPININVPSTAPVLLQVQDDGIQEIYVYNPDASKTLWVGGPVGGGLGLGIGQGIPIGPQKYDKFRCSGNLWGVASTGTITGVALTLLCNGIVTARKYMAPG